MYNTPFFHIVLEFLKQVGNSLSAQLQGDIRSGKATLEDQTLYIKKNFAGGGIINLITPTTERIDGICSFDKNILQTGRVFVFDEISIGYAKDAALGKEGSLKYNIVAPAPLLNADFVIIQNGKEVLRKSVADLHNLAAGQNVKDQFTTLKGLKFLTDAKEIKMQLVFPDGVVMDDTTDKHYIYVRLNGLQTAIKS
ncbi:hypothetical protein [Flavobacterium commune]|uniref:hypothetical protein n=1 Tax=Flavobacterium commune TaxID=1306519 RepID=UPI0012FB61EE|nr:hypothetical protein [Flavobacterium commune]